MRYAVPRVLARCRRTPLGIHGASHKFIAERSAELLGRDDIAARGRRSLCTAAVRARQHVERAATGDLLSPGRQFQRHGHSMASPIGNSFGMSPQSGLPQNNRVGDLDVSAVPLRQCGRLA